MIKKYSHRSKDERKTGRGKIVFSLRKVTVETEKGEVYYVFDKYHGGYVHGDIVEYVTTRLATGGKLTEVKPVRLVRRSSESIMIEKMHDGKGGKWQILEGLGVLDINVVDPPERAKKGDIYTGKFAGKKEIKIEKYIGNVNDKETEEKIILMRNGIRTEWPKELEGRVKSEGGKIPPKRDIGDIEKIDTREKLSSLFPRVAFHGRDRTDFRSWTTITIDGADARDLDDAISIYEYENSDLLLAVHIADVAEYVREGGALDHEAYLRGTSVYTPGRVIPMLPEYLSNDLCSLHPGGTKATFSILMRVNSRGIVEDSYITEGLIESIHRGVYEEIEECIQNGFSIEYLGTQRGSGKNTVGDRGEQKIEERSERVYSSPRPLVTFSHESNIKITKSLKNFYKLYKILEARRKKEGKILFEMTECYFTVDEERNVKDIRKRERGEAHMLIEEFMILANEEVAKWCAKEGLPFLSRVHSAPESEDMKTLALILEQASLERELRPHHLREILEKAKDLRERYRLSRLILPKMSKAHYGDVPKGHFGLALAYYAHFTSPIRRYPDLLVHRIIKSHLVGALSREKKSEYARQMKKIGLSLSEKEKRAEMAERAIDSLMMCRYMSDKIGKIYTGMISGLTESNIYVELESGVEGSIFLGRSKNSSSRKSTGDILSPDKKLKLDEIRGALRDTKGEVVYEIGQSIDIRILSVDMKERRIELNVRF